jgi:YgiT-type zinc finger domain-containing protein
MKCPACGHPEMEAKTKDETLSYGRQSLTLHAMRGEFCPKCGEGVWDSESYKRYIEAQGAMVLAGKGDMKSSSDKMFEKFKDLDFACAKRVAETPHLAKLQAQAGNKTRITMRIDNDVLAVFKARAAMVGGNYQTMMNDALRQFAQGLTLSDVVREAVREGLDACLSKGTTRATRKRAAG